ncbi:MAG: DNA polymerase IV [Candidatus Nitrospinota bacterium M3_3B_026]
MSNRAADNKRRIILHVDMDAFFVSVEEVLNPALRGRPVIVGGDPDGRGVVSSASYKAREYGVRSAMPMAQARRLCPKGIFIRGDHRVYSEYSRRIMDILRRYTPGVEVVSVDEAYLDVTGCLRALRSGPVGVAQSIRDAVMADSGVPASIGIASSKLVAKMASGMAKPDGLLYILPGREADFLRPLPVRKMPGVGPATARSLNALGIRHIGDLARVPAEKLERVLGSLGPALSLRARGEGPSDVEAEPAEAASIGRETTYARDTRDVSKIEATLSYLCESVGGRLRREGMLFRRVAVKIRYGDFTTRERSVTIFEPSDDTGVMFRAARGLLRGSLERGRPVRLAGVTVSALSAPPRQMNLFRRSEAPSAAGRLWRGMDEARDRFGFGAVMLARSYIHSAAGDGKGS